MYCCTNLCKMFIGSSALRLGLISSGMIMIGRSDRWFGDVQRLYFRQDLIPILYHLLLTKPFSFTQVRSGIPLCSFFTNYSDNLLGSISVSFASSCFFTRVIESALIECTLYQRHSYKRNKERLICYCNPSNMKTAVFGRYSARHY